MAKVLISEEILQETAEAIKNTGNMVVLDGLKPVDFATAISNIKRPTTGLPALPDDSETVYEEMHAIFEHAFINTSTNMALPRKITIRGGSHPTLQFNFSSGCVARLLMLHIDKGVTGIQSLLVNNANRLVYIRIGEDVTFIKANAFRTCPLIETIVFDGTVPPTVAANAFTNNGGVPLENVREIIIPEGSLEAYEEALAESGLDISRLTELPPEDWEEDGAIYWIEYDIIQNDIANS